MDNAHHTPHIAAKAIPARPSRGDSVEDHIADAQIRKCEEGEH
jgi:hypothetical protein